DLRKRLAGELRHLICTVASAEAAWEQAAAPVVARRESNEQRRELMRLVVRGWREVVDGRRAGAAHWQARWERGSST
ncbi:MAG: hypothetical protein VX839_09430, partial [Verrucomicrobiota bacterium]|nr:hypothetical protein [Verrucomicrobiota bacterium]